MPEKILDLTPFFLAHCSRDLRYVSVSRSYAALLGLEPNEIVGKRVIDVVGAAGFETMRPHIEAALAGEQVEYEAEIKVGDLGPREYHVNLSPERDEQNKVIGYVASVIDVTERNRATKEKIRLERLVAQLHLPLVQAQIGIWDWDLRTNSLDWTPELKAIYGLEAVSVETYADFRERVHPDDIQNYEASRDAAVKAHEISQVEFRIIRPDGQVRWVLSVGGAVYDKVTDEPIRIIGSNIDITARKAAEMQDQLQREELTHLMRVMTLGGLSGGIAHELSQPLASILANAQAAEAMLRTKDPNLAGVMEILEEIVEEDYRAGQVIRRLRQLLQKGEHHETSINLNDLIASTLQLLHAELVTRNIKVDTELRTDLPSISGDSVELQQVLINLVMNAIEAMVSIPPSKRKLSITTEETKEGNVVVSIKDWGPGVSPDKLKRILEPFFTTKAAGLGLGLSICSTIVAVHNGQLKLRNASDGGIVATVSLPKRVQLAMVS